MAAWWKRSFNPLYGAYVFLTVGFILLAVAAPDDKQALFRPELLAGKVIAIDPGHGGIDGGAVSTLGDFEKEITLQVGRRVADRLAGAGAKVVMTRDQDIDFYTRGKGGKRNDLEQRVAIAQDNGAELFISIHANAIKGRRWTGAQMFYQTASEQGQKLAGSMQQYLQDFPPGNRRKEKPGDFYVLRENTIPAAIVEVGFLSNPTEAARLKDEEYQEKMAEAIFRGIVHYVAETAPQ